jgi:hypothetical protein
MVRQSKGDKVAKEKVVIQSLKHLFSFIFWDYFFFLLELEGL